MGDEGQAGQAVTGAVEIQLDRPRQIRYSIGILREAEAALGGFVGPLGLNILCSLLMYGLRPDDPKLTLKKLDGLLDDYLHTGGSIEKLSRKVRVALERAGVAWGRSAAVCNVADCPCTCHGQPVEPDEAPA